MKHILWGVLVFFGYQVASGQVLFHGHAVDAASKLPVVGAVVTVNGYLPVVTDNSGRFDIEVASGSHSIRVQHVAYDTYDSVIAVDNEQHFDVFLEPRKVQLEGVTISALRDLHATGSITPVVMKPGATEFSSDVNLHLGALLRSIPGVSSVNTGASSGVPWIRGLGGSRIGVFVDGVPQQNQQWAVDHGTDLDPWMAEQISVYKGPATLTFGSNASAGAIVVDPVSELPEKSLSVGAFSRAQSVNDGVEGGFRYRQRFKKLQVEARFIERSFADYRVPAEEFIHLNRVLPIYDQRLVNTSGNSSAQQVRLRWIEGRSSWRLEYRRSEQESGIFPGIFGVPSIPSLQGDRNPRQTQLPAMTSLHQAASLVYENHLLNGGSLRLTTGWQQSLRQELGPPHTHGNTPLPDNPLALELDLHTWFAAVNFEKTLERGKKLFVGGQAEHLTNASNGWEFLVSDYQSTSAGVYGGLEGLATVFGGRLDAGVRADFAQVNTSLYAEPVYNETQEIIGSNVLSDATNRDFPGISASISWGREIKRHQRIAVQASRTIRFPTPYELAANGVHHGTFRHEQGQSNLSTETGYQLDLRWTGFSGNVTWELSPFAGFYDNFIYLRPAARFSHLPHAGQLYQFSQSNVMRAGGEVLVNVKASKSLMLTATGEYVNAYNVDQGMALPWTPPLKGELAVNWEPFNDRKSHPSDDPSLYLRTTFTAVAAQNLVDRNELSTNSYELLSISLGGTIRPLGRLQWSIYANNLFNRTYIDHLSRYKLLNLPEPGRNFGVLLIYEFNHFSNNH